MSKKIKKQIKEWIILIGVFGTLYVTGWHTEVIGQLQRLIVASGIMQAEVLDESEQLNANYQFSIKNMKGDVVAFEEFKGKTIFLNFWATWCAPCVAEMPDIYNLYKKLEGREDVAFVLISVDDDLAKVQQFIQRKEYEFPIYFLASHRPSVFQNNTVPTTYIISKEGKIVAKRSGMAKYDTEEIRALFKI
ncbi:MAG: TlpA family protein disulfide reductase [Reichenbachiella sp.]